MVELSATVGVFGWVYFRSWFNCPDAAVIVLRAPVDVLLEGAVGGIASFVVVLRLLRVFVIIEQVRSSTQRRVVGIQEQVEFLSKENGSLGEDVR